MLDSGDTALVRRAQGGDVSAIGELYDRHHERIFRYVWSRVNNKNLAEDLTGEIFTRMVSNLPDYRSVGLPFPAWLYRIAHNLIVDHYRKNSGRSPLPLDHAESLSGGRDNPDSIVEHNVTLERLRRALERLDQAQREVVVLRFLAGLSLQEVALALDKTVAAVKSLQHRGLAALRVELAQE